MITTEAKCVRLLFLLRFLFYIELIISIFKSVIVLHRVKYARIMVFVDPYSLKDRIIDSVFIRENADQWIPVFSPILCSVALLIHMQFFDTQMLLTYITVLSLTNSIFWWWKFFHFFENSKYKLLTTSFCFNWISIW